MDFIKWGFETEEKGGGGGGEEEDMEKEEDQTPKRSTQI